MRRLLVLLMCSILALVTPAASANGKPLPRGVDKPFPRTIPLPAGSYPEGIAVGTGTDFYVGSLFGGGVYAGDLRTGKGSVVVPSVEGRVVAGLSFDPRSKLLWGVGLDVGGPTIFAFDTAAGALAHALPVPAGRLLNDLTITRTAIYVTDSFSQVLWVVPLTPRGLPSGPATALWLENVPFVTGGDFPINLNGIAATRDGRWLLSVHSTLGVLYRIDPGTGDATEVDLGEASLALGDGIVLHGRALYVVQSFLQQVAVVALDPGLGSGRLTEVITSGLFRVPATAALFGSGLYVVNARFDAAFPPFFGAEPKTLDYDVVRVPR